MAFTGCACVHVHQRLIVLIQSFGKSDPSVDEGVLARTGFLKSPSMLKTSLWAPTPGSPQGLCYWVYSCTSPRAGPEGQVWWKAERGCVCAPQPALSAGEAAQGTGVGMRTAPGLMCLGWETRLSALPSPTTRKVLGFSKLKIASGAPGPPQKAPRAPYR